MKIRPIASALFTALLATSLVALLACGGGVVAGCSNSGETDAAPPAPPKGQPLPAGNNLSDPSKPAAGYTGPATGRGGAAGGGTNQGK